MKKIFVFAAALALIAGSVSAVDLGEGFTLGGEVKTGVDVSSEDYGDDIDGTRVSAYNNDAGQEFRARLTAAYTGDWGGGKIRFQGDGKGLSFSVKYAYGWVNLLDKKVVVSAGAIGDDKWGLGQLEHEVFDPSLDAVYGLRGEFKIVDGLSFGLALPISTTPFDSTQPAITIGNYVGSVVFGGLYKHDAFTAAASVGLKPAWNTEPYTGKDLDWSQGYADILLGVDVPLDKLFLTVVSRIDTHTYDKNKKRFNIKEEIDGNSVDTTGYVRIGPYVQYTVDKLTAHVLGDIAIGTDDEVPMSPNAGGGNIKQDKEGKYENTSIAFRVGASYAASETISPYLQVGSDNIGWFEGNGLYAKLGSSFTFGSSSIEIFDKISGIGAENGKYVYTTEEFYGDTSNVKNQFQVDFNLSF